MSLTPEEVEFLAEKEPIKVVPNFNSNKLLLISGDVGPFRAGIPVFVPLWLAIKLREQYKCRIVTPDWMEISRLEEVKAAEEGSEMFTRMPAEHYMAISRLLFEVCPNDIPEADVAKTLIKDIWDIRSAKLKKSVSLVISQGLETVPVRNLTMLEICSIRPFLPDALTQLFRLKRELNK